MKTTRRGILHTLVLSLAVALASTACGDFKDYDDRVFDFPEKAAPPVPNPIPYEPPPEEPAPEPAAEEKKAEEPVAAAAPESEKKPVKAEKKDASGVKSIKVKGEGGSDDGSGSSGASVLPPDSPHPVASEELDADSEGPGRVEPENAPPRKNVGHRLDRGLSKRQKMLDRMERQLQEGDDPGMLRGGGRRRPPALGGRDGKMHHGGRGLGRAKNGD